jgi:hypothetical protein
MHATTRRARRLLGGVLLTALLATPALGQVRQRGQEFRDLQALLQIIFAVFDLDNDIDTPQGLAAFNQLYGRNDPFSLFDRDRNGSFTNDGGVADVDLAIQQFNHDLVDFDGDGVGGFVELECAFAGGPELQPDDPTTIGIVPDAQQDCDGDGMTNGYEITGGLDALNGNDGALDPDQDGLTNTQEFAAGTNPTRADSDVDGIPDGVEVGPNPNNPLNTDGNGPIDALDTDSDDDGTLDGADNCRTLANADQANADQDATGDACDADDDGDGRADAQDNCPGGAERRSGQHRRRRAGRRLRCATTTTTPWPTAQDNCPTVANQNQARRSTPTGPATPATLDRRQRRPSPIAQDNCPELDANAEPARTLDNDAAGQRLRPATTTTTRWPTRRTTAR